MGNNFLLTKLINFILLLRKVLYLYDYMDDWEKIDKALLLRKEDISLT